MKITDEAKALISEALAANGCDCVQITLEKSCCGTSVSFAMAKIQPGETPELVNGISVMMDRRTKERAETVTLTARNGELAIQDTSQSCCS